MNDKCKDSNTKYEEPEYPFRENALIRDYNALYLKIYDKVKYVDM